jgi:hypothetical protein
VLRKNRPVRNIKIFKLWREKMSFYAQEDYEYEYEQGKPWEVREVEKKLEKSQEFMIALYEELTSEHPIDLNAVQFFMSEIAGHLDINDTRFGRLTIERDTKIIQFSGV